MASVSARGHSSLQAIYQAGFLVLLASMPISAAAQSGASSQPSKDLNRVIARPTPCPWGMSGSLEGGCYNDGSAALAGWPGLGEYPFSTRLVPLRDDRYSLTADSMTGKPPEMICRSNPIDIATGRKVEDVVDFAASDAVEMPLSLVRKYRSMPVLLYPVTIFGYVWQSNIDDIKLEFDGPYPRPDCVAYPGRAQCSATDTQDRPYFRLHMGDTGIKFKVGTDGVYRETKAVPVANAIRNSDGTFTVNTEDNQILKFTTGGFLLEKKTRSGVGWVYSYGGLNGTQLQTVTHTSGRSIGFTWTGNVVTQVRDPAGNIYNYSYIEPAGFSGSTYYLKNVTLPGAPTTTVTYHYSNEATYGAGQLVGKSYQGIRYSTYSYLGGKAVSSEHAGVERSTFSYTDNGGEVTVSEINPAGKKTNYLFDFKRRLVSVDGLASAHCAAASKGADYGYDGYKTGETDFNGNLTTYQYHASGRLMSKTEGAGTPVARTTTYVWDDAKNQILKETLEGVQEIAYTYDAQGRLTRAVTKNISAAVSASKDRVRAIAYTYTNHPSGILASRTIEGPLPGAKLTYRYSAAGDLISIENNAGHLTTYGGHDGLGKPAYVISPNGDRRDITYDARGRVTSERNTVNGAVQTTVYAYDGFGRLASVTYPDGVKHGFQYDVPGRLISEYVSEGGGQYAQKVYTYNTLSLPTSIKTRRISFEPAQGTVQ